MAKSGKGVPNNVAAILSIIFGIVILWKPQLLAYLIAAYLIIKGILDLV